MLKHAAAALLVLTIGLVFFKGGGGEKSLKDEKISGGTIADELLVDTISHGETVDIEDHLISGRWTVVEFYADW